MANDYKDRASLPRRGGKSTPQSAPTRRTHNRRKPSKPTPKTANPKRYNARINKPSIQDRFDALQLDIPDLQQKALMLLVIGTVIGLFSYFLSSLSGEKKTSEPKRFSRPLQQQFVQNISVKKPVEITRRLPLQKTPTIKVADDVERYADTKISVAKPFQVKPAIVKPKPATSVKPKVTALVKPDIKYQFYSVLPDAEFIIPDYEIKTRKRQERVGKAKQGVQYTIQVGAFRNKADAEKLRAELVLMAFSPKIETVTIKTVPWHRVKLGPYKRMNSISILLGKLKDKGIDAIVSEVKQ